MAKAIGIEDNEAAALARSSASAASAAEDGVAGAEFTEIPDDERK